LVIHGELQKGKDNGILTAICKGYKTIRPKKWLWNFKSITDEEN
jgi:hypothetical protein